MFQSVPVPFVIIGNRRGLTDAQLASDPALAEFVALFASAFEWDALRSVWLFVEDDA